MPSFHVNFSIVKAKAIAYGYSQIFSIIKSFGKGIIENLIHIVTMYTARGESLHSFPRKTLKLIDYKVEYVFHNIYIAIRSQIHGVIAQKQMSLCEEH